MELYTVNEVAAKFLKATPSLINTLIEAGFLKGINIAPGVSQPEWRCTEEAIVDCIRRLQEQQKVEVPTKSASSPDRLRLPALMRINLKPAAGQTDPRQLCLDRGVVGVGWAVDDVDIDQELGLSWEEYCRRAREKYGATWGAVATLHDLPRGSVMWTRTGYGREKTRFYVGMIIGNWKYCVKDNEAQDADIVNVRQTSWVEVGGYAAVPPGIAKAFTPSTLQAMRDPEAVRFSENLAINLIATGRWEALSHSEA